MQYDRVGQWSWLPPSKKRIPPTAVAGLHLFAELTHLNIASPRTLPLFTNPIDLPLQYTDYKYSRRFGLVVTRWPWSM